MGSCQHEYLLDLIHYGECLLPKKGKVIVSLFKH